MLLIKVDKTMLNLQSIMYANVWCCINTKMAGFTSYHEFTIYSGDRLKRSLFECKCTYMDLRCTQPFCITYI